MRRLTDKRAIEIALHLATDYEESLIDAYRNPIGQIDENAEGVAIARKNIEAFKRVLDRYFAGSRPPVIDGGRPVSIYTLVA